jgi:cytochrome c
MSQVIGLAFQRFIEYDAGCKRFDFGQVILESDGVINNLTLCQPNLEKEMTVKSLPRTLLVAVASVGLALALPAAAQVDEDAAKLLFKQNECGKCHNPEKNKKGPSLKKTAKEYKGKANAEQELIKHMTSGKKVKLDDGSEEDHKIIDTKDPKALSNLAKWILSH